MLIKCHCHHCQNPIEFEAENAGQSITCPHCQQLTVLALPVRLAPSFKEHPRLMPCAHCGVLIARKAFECPSCGGPTKIKPSVFYYVFVGVVSLIVTGLILAFFAFIGSAFLSGAIGPHGK